MTPNDKGPATSRGYVLAGPRSLQLEERALPELEDDWVRLRFLYCGLCGSTSRFTRDGPTRPTRFRSGTSSSPKWRRSAPMFGCCPGRYRHQRPELPVWALRPLPGGPIDLCRTGQQGLFTNRDFSDFGDIHASYLLRLNGPPRNTSP